MHAGIIILAVSIPLIVIAQILSEALKQLRYISDRLYDIQLSLSEGDDPDDPDEDEDEAETNVIAIGKKAA